MLEILPSVLIFSGALLLIFSLIKTSNIMRLISSKKKRSPWHLLRTLMGGFSIGYIIAIIILYYTNNGLLFEGSFVLVALMGIIFFFGALFVFLVVRVSYQSISNLTESNILISKQKEEKERDEEIRKKINESLEKKNKELESFNHRISEDLSTPLNAIYNLSKTLTGGGANTEAMTDKLRLDTIIKMNEMAESTQVFINDLLAYTSMDMNEAKEEIDANILISKILDEMQELVTEKKADIKVTTLPVLNAPPLLFHQVFYQLILNALQYSHLDRLPMIEVFCHVHRDTYVFQVSDNGQGIPSIFLADIFLLFKKGEQSKSNRSSGIGLTLCQKVVESWGGVIEVESIPGKGSSFSFSIPKEG